MRKKIFISLILAAIFCLSGLVAADAQYLEKLERAEQLWGSANLKKYSYTLKSGGVFGYTTYKISVNNGKCKSKSRYVMGKTASAWARAACDGQTIVELFDKLRSQLMRGVEDIRLEFDPVFGYPKYFYIEPKTDLEDQSWYVEISRFKG